MCTGCKTSLRGENWALDHFSFQSQPYLPQSMIYIYICLIRNNNLLHLSDPLWSLIPISFFRKRHRETTTRESSDSSDADADMGQDLSVGPFEHEEVEIGQGVPLWAETHRVIPSKSCWTSVILCRENPFQSLHVVIQIVYVLISFTTLHPLVLFWNMLLTWNPEQKKLQWQKRLNLWQRRPNRWS
jgi:hypothetical protein